MDLQRILGNEELLAQVLDEVRSDRMTDGLRAASLDPDRLRVAAENVGRGLESGAPPEYEAIILRIGRPVLFIQDDEIQVPEIGLWRRLITRAQGSLAKATPAVGRIEVHNHPDFDWIGTGWLVAPDVVVTNRHVATEFARRVPDGFAFAYDPDDRLLRVEIDFKAEHERATSNEFRVRNILHVEEPAPGAVDLAFLQVERESSDEQPLPSPIALAESDTTDGRVIGCVGYAAWDGRRNEPEWMGKIFGDVYDVKRLHPGEVMAIEERRLTHDCSTLGGNSGSAVLDLESGEAVGLHFGGRFGAQNYAVKASTIRDRLARLAEH